MPSVMERIRARVEQKKVVAAASATRNGRTANVSPPLRASDAKSLRVAVPQDLSLSEALVLESSPHARAQERIQRRRSARQTPKTQVAPVQSVTQPQLQSQPQPHKIRKRVPMKEAVVSPDDEFDLDSSSDDHDDDRAGTFSGSVEHSADSGSPTDDRASRSGSDDSQATSLSVGPENESAPVSDSAENRSDVGVATLPSSPSAQYSADRGVSPGLSTPIRRRMSERDSLEAEWIEVEMRKADDKFLQVTEEMANTERELDDAQQELQAAQQRCKLAKQQHMAAMRNLESASSTLRHLVKLKHGLESKYSKAPIVSSHVDPKDVLRATVLGELHDHAMSADFRQFEQVFKKHPSVVRAAFGITNNFHHSKSYQLTTGETLLLTAARVNSIPIVQLLLSYGANPNIADKYGMTPMHLAARLGNNKMFHTLLGAGGKPSTRNSDGLTALDEMQQKSPRMFQAHEKNTAAVKRIHAQEASRGMQLAEMLSLGIQVPNVPILSSGRIQGMCIAGAAVEHHSSLLRSMLWKLLLAFLPWTPTRWEFSVFSHRVKYRCLRAEITPSWRCMLHNAPPPTGSTVANSGTGVQPPSTSDGGCPDTEYDDMATMELRRQIYVDLVRMRRDFPEHHRNAVARILFIFAQMHPDISYVQGMHDVCAALYFQFLNDNKKNTRTRASGEGSPTHLSGSGGSGAEYWLPDEDLFSGIDLHSPAAVEKLLSDPDKMRKILQRLRPAVNTDNMSTDELFTRLKQAHATAIANHDDMEMEGEEVDWELIDAAESAQSAESSDPDPASPVSGVQRFGDAVRRALAFPKKKKHQPDFVDDAGHDFVARSPPRSRSSSRRHSGWGRRGSRSSVDSVDSDSFEDLGAQEFSDSVLAIRLDHNAIKGRIERHWLSATPFEVEADTFFCFRALVRRMRRLFHCKEGLNETLSFLQNAFELLDKPLYKHLMGLSPPLTPTFYSLPWLLTLFSQGVSWRVVQRMWDAFLTHDAQSENGLNVEFIICFAIALARSLRSLLLESDFAGAMAVLHGALGSLNFNSESVLIVARDSYKQLRKSNLRFQPTAL